MNRSYNLSASFSASLVSKCLTLLVQLIAIPFAVSNFGAERYILYTALLSLNAWLMLSTGGIAASVVVRLAELNDRRAWDAWALGAYRLFCVIGLLGVLAILSIEKVSSVLAAILPNTTASDYDITLFMVLTLFFVQCLSAGSEALVLSLHKSYLLSLTSTLSALSIILVLSANLLEFRNVYQLILLIYIIPGILKILTGYFIVANKLGRQKFGLLLPQLRYYATNSWVYFRGGAVANALLHVLPVLLVGKFYDVTFAAQYVTVNTGILMASGLMSVITTPLVPALRHAYATAQTSWVELQLRRLLVYIVIVSVLLISLSVTLLPGALELYFGETLKFDSEQIISATIYLTTLFFSNLNYVTFVAKGQAEAITKIFFVKSLAAILVLSALIFFGFFINPFNVFIGVFFFECAAIYTLKKLVLKKIGGVDNQSLADHEF